jgi:hypothetical protein
MSGSLGQLNSIYNISLFSTRGLRPSSRTKKNMKIIRDSILTCLQELPQGCLQPDIRRSVSMAQGNAKANQTYLRTLVVPLA